MTPTYAANTDVPVARSRDEIERTLARYGATSFAYAAEPGRAAIRFTANDRQIRFIILLPDKNEERFTHHSRGARTETAALAAWEQACRQKWRALAMVVKAKLEAVSAGIVSFEDEFLAHTLLPSGLTVAEEIRDDITTAITTDGPLQIGW